jgi:hypothetical protein
VRTHVELRSRAFPADPDEDELVNPGQFGRRLAQWVHQVLVDAGVRATEPIAEDWGWVVPIDDPAFRLWVGCANLEDAEDRFLVFVHPHKPTVRKGFRKVATASSIEPVTGAIDAGLRAHPEVDEVRWWAPEEIPG